MTEPEPGPGPAGGGREERRETGGSQSAVSQAGWTGRLSLYRLIT